jgi:hypothetical protein
MDVWVTPPVQGTVFDAVTNAPIPNANVGVISDKAGVTATALTKSAGHLKPSRELQRNGERSWSTILSRMRE